MLSTLFLATLILSAPAPDPETGLVRGQVRSETTRNGLPFAIVEVIAENKRLVTVTDAAGNYVIRVSAGPRLLRASHIDHAPLEVEVLVPAGGEVVLDLVLELRPVRLPGVKTAAEAALDARSDLQAARAPGLAAAAVRALEATPGMAELGLADAARGVPGREPADPSDVLYVRGDAADLKLVLLDGAPVYAPFHLGGLIDAFEPEVLRAANLYLGGAPARYDGGLSYVLDLETRAARRDGTRLAGALDLLGVRGTMEGPLAGRAGYLVAGRAVHALGAPVFTDDPFPYRYADGLARLDLETGAWGTLAFTGFSNRESVELEDPGGGAGAAGWGNAAASLRYHDVIAGTDAEFIASFGSFYARLPIGGGRPLWADGSARRLRMIADFSHPAGATTLDYGLSYDHLWLQYRAWPRSAGRDSLLLEVEREGDVAGAYADAAWQALPFLRVRGGLRADFFSLQPEPRLAPRVSATWLLGERAALTLAAGRYRQFVRAPAPALVAEPDRAANGEQAGPPPPPLAVARASHVVVALRQDLGEGVRLGIEGFFKTFDGLPAEETSRGQASGIDLWARRSTGRVTGWLGYSLAWIWSLEGQRNVTRLFAGRHLLNAGLAGPLGTNGGFQLRVGYGAGLPYTAIPDADITSASPSTFPRPAADGGDDDPVPPKLAQAPEEPYLRLDAEIKHTWTPHLHGFAFEVTPYFKVLNALDRRDALFYRYDAWRDTEPRAVASLPVVPVVGVAWRF
ncbi:MAG: carboxypeptidase regulatory-like domain-containing protein [Gemmatimonadetes bacterium]|nr:carboxypeptidase regulatory-like domain-containing protein [Gemmatimonadota bacterium]